MWIAAGLPPKTSMVMGKLTSWLTKVQPSTADRNQMQLSWAEFTVKVYNFWRIVGPPFRERPKDEPRV
eukprot:4215054-Amphidinium_carterae.2